MKSLAFLTLLLISSTSFAASSLPKIYSCNVNAYFTRSLERVPESNWLLVSGAPFSANFLGDNFTVRIDGQDRLTLSAAAGAISPKRGALETSWIGKQSSGTISCSLHKPQANFLMRNLSSNSLFYVTEYKGSAQWSWTASPQGNCFYGDGKGLAQFLVNRRKLSKKDERSEPRDNRRIQLMKDGRVALGTEFFSPCQ